MAKVELAPQTLLIPNPAALITCGRMDGASNIITLAWVGTVCSEPPMLGIGVRPSRYSYELIKATGEFVVNLPTAEMVVPTDFCGMKSGRDVDKFAATGLTKATAKVVAVPLIAECPISIECVVRQSHLLGTHDYIIGEIVAVHVEESLRDAAGRVQPGTAGFLAYGAGGYMPVGTVVGMHGCSKGLPRA